MLKRWKWREVGKEEEEEEKEEEEEAEQEKEDKLGKDESTLMSEWGGSKGPPPNMHTYTYVHCFWFSLKGEEI